MAESETDLQMADGIDGTANLKEERDRAGKDALTKSERLTMLDEIYDGLLFSWRQNVTLGFSKGSSAISYQLERARLEMDGLNARHGVIDATDHGLSIAGLDPALILVNGTGERIEA